MVGDTVRDGCSEVEGRVGGGEGVATPFKTGAHGGFASWFSTMMFSFRAVGVPAEVLLQFAGPVVLYEAETKISTGRQRRPQGRKKKTQKREKAPHQRTRRRYKREKDRKKKKTTVATLREVAQVMGAFVYTYSRFRCSLLPAGYAESHRRRQRLA